MKKILLSFVFVMSAFAGTEFELVRALDGTVKNCETKWDLRRGRTGTYTAKILSAELLDNKIKASVELTFKVCEGTKETGFSFVPLMPMDKFSFMGIPKVKNGDGDLYEVTPLAIAFGIDKDGVFDSNAKPITTPLENKSVQVVSIEYDLAKAFDGEKLDKKSGESYNRYSVDFFVTRRLKWENLDGDYKDNSTSFLGGYRLIAKQK